MPQRFFLSRRDGSSPLHRTRHALLVARGANGYDCNEQVPLETGDFRQAIEDGALHWQKVSEWGQVILGRAPGRTDASDVTLFNSLGLGIEDITTAAQVVAKAKANNVGRMIEW